MNASTWVLDPLNTCFSEEKPGSSVSSSITAGATSAGLAGDVADAVEAPPRVSRAAAPKVITRVAF